MSTTTDFATCDLCDAHKAGYAEGDGALRVLPPVFASYGGRARFCGAVLTVKCFEDNSPVKAALESAGEGRVLVVDGGGSLRRALIGGNIAAALTRSCVAAAFKWICGAFTGLARFANAV